jgi:hypothetical protein
VRSDLSCKAFIDWDGWLWDWRGNTPILLSKNAEEWLAGYNGVPVEEIRAALKDKTDE